MHSQFSARTRNDFGSTRWDALCEESHDAWLFHTSCWLPILGIEDVSFAVTDRDDNPLALVGLGSPRDHTGTDLCLSSLRAGIAHMNGLSPEFRHELDRFALSEVQRIATSKRAVRIDWELPSMPPGPDASVSALAESGYHSDVWPAKVIDLTLDEDALWNAYRKGCRSVIRRAQRLGVTVQEVTDESGVAVFSDMHSRRMRSIGASSPTTDVFMDMWRLLAPLGRCEILLASLPSGLAVSGILLLSYKNAVYYHAACSDPGHMDSGGNTLLVHEAVLRAKSGGATAFHLGPSPLASQVAEKAYLVGRFKNQFGGQQSAWVVASRVLRTDPPPVVRRHFTVRSTVSAVLPPGAKRRLRSLRPAPPDDDPVRLDGLFGDFPDWASAQAASEPYHTDLAVYGQITDQVRLGEAGSGRNLMPILAGLAMAHDGGGTRVLDFGGNLGVVYFDVTRVLPDRVSGWRVVDCQEVVDHGNAKYSDNRLSFFTSSESACRDFAPNMILCSHTLQYLERPYETLEMLSTLNSAVIVLHELPVAEHERFMIQRLPEGLGGTERPVQILSSRRLAAALSSYDLVADMDLPPWVPDIDARHAAQVYRRRLQIGDIERVTIE